MTKLQLKSYIYKYTGWYLAHEEENDYLQSKEFWKELKKILANPENDMSPRNASGLLLGLWQADHGFGRCMSNYKFKKPKLIFVPVAFFDEMLTMIKWDLKDMYRKSFGGKSE